MLGPFARRAVRLVRKAKLRMLDARKTSYERWIAERLRIRAGLYPVQVEPEGAELLSFVTSVWDTPPEYMRVLVKSVLKQRGGGPFEWVVLDNGSTKAETIHFLRSLNAHSLIRLYRVEENRGIIGGMRFCLEHARNRYILPLDSDDYLYPDCTQIVTSFLQRHHFPALLYSDEDKLVGTRFREPYFKPDWDPVLFTNSCFVAHLCVIERKTALALDAYSDAGSNGSHDWDTFVRFLAAGIEPVHIPEILYSWRIHAASTSGNIDAKSYIHSSQKNVLTRFLRDREKPQLYQIDYSPLFDRSPDWWIRRKHEVPRPLSVVFFGNGALGRRNELEQRLLSMTDYPIQQVIGVSEEELIPWLKESRGREKCSQVSGALIALIHAELRVEGGEWPWEALTQFELYADTRVVGGLLARPSDHVILSAGQYFGFGRGCGTPERGTAVGGYGYFGQIRKQHSVSAVSAQFCVLDEGFLPMADLGAHSKTLGAWLGASAKRSGVRVIYTPFLQGWTDVDWEGIVSDQEMNDFLAANRDVVPETALLSRHLGLTPSHLGLTASHRYLPVAPAERHRQIRRLLK